jgi:hypothetical protein
MIGGGQTGFPFSPPNILSSVKEIISFNSEMTLCKGMKKGFFRVESPALQKYDHRDASG